MARSASHRTAWGLGGQGWIRTSVRSRGQIYSLLPLTTRPPVLGARLTASAVHCRPNASLSTPCARLLARIASRRCRSFFKSPPDVAPRTPAEPGPEQPPALLRPPRGDRRTGESRAHGAQALGNARG